MTVHIILQYIYRELLTHCFRQYQHQGTQDAIQDIRRVIGIRCRLASDDLLAIQIKIRNEVTFSTPFGEKNTFLYSILLICDCG